MVTSGVSDAVETSWECVTAAAADPSSQRVAQAMDALDEHFSGRYGAQSAASSRQLEQEMITAWLVRVLHPQSRQRPPPAAVLGVVDIAIGLRIFAADDLVATVERITRAALL